jgi:ribosomal protein L7Ae-like RNA K-turn-binding protein
MDKNLQILGLTKKAGMLAIGTEDTISAARAGKAQAVISSCDASGNALRRAKNSAKTGAAIYIVVPYTSFELGRAIGRGSPATAAILSTELAARSITGLAEEDPERFIEAAEAIMRKAAARREKMKRASSAKRRAVQ